MDLTTSHARLSGAGRDFIARHHKLLIDRQWVDAKSGQTFAVFDPSNGQQIAQVGDGGAEDIAAAVAAARRAFEHGPWARMKPTERGKLVWRLGDVLEARAVERTRFGRSGIYDVTVRRGDDVIAEFRGTSRTIGKDGA